jgi:hypothetical protein
MLESTEKLAPAHALELREAADQQRRHMVLPTPPSGRGSSAGISPSAPPGGSAAVPHRGRVAVSMQKSSMLKFVPSMAAADGGSAPASGGNSPQSAVAPAGSQPTGLPPRRPQS